MNTAFIHFRILLCLLLAPSLIAACVPVHTTEKTAIVIFNDTTNILQYQISLNNRLNTPGKIRSNEFEYVYLYESTNPMKSLPSELSQIILEYSNCRITLNKPDLSRLFNKDPESRNSWDLHITNDFADQFQCTQ